MMPSAAEARRRSHPFRTLGGYLLRTVIAMAALVASLDPFTLALVPFLVLAIALTFRRFNRRFFSALLAPFALAPDGRAEARLVAAFFAAVAVAVGMWGVIVVTIPQGDRTNGHWLLIPAVGTVALVACVLMAVRRSRARSDTP